MPDNEPLTTQLDVSKFLSTPDDETAGESDTTNDVVDPFEGIDDLDPEALLKHPTLGPKFQSYIDKTFAAQMKGQTERIRTEVRAELAPEVTQQVKDQMLDQHFSALSQEALGHELAGSPDLAASYSRIQAAKAATPDPKVQQAIDTVAGLVSMNLGRLAGLPEDVQAKLQPEDYKQFGSEALTRWVTDIDKAILESGSKLDEEAKQQEQLLAEKKPGAVRAARVTSKSPAPDLVTTNSRALLEHVLSK